MEDLNTWPEQADQYYVNKPANLMILILILMLIFQK